MSGAGGQTTLIIPSHDLVVVRLGHFNGVTLASQSLQPRSPCSCRRCRKGTGTRGE